MKIKGQLLKCDICGAMEFLEAIGEGETDGGYTRWTTFASSPKEWERITLKGSWIDICPTCYAEFLRQREEMEENYVNSMAKCTNNDISIVTKE